MEKSKHLDPQQLKQTAELIKELAGTSRIKRRRLWNYWLGQKSSFLELPFEERRKRFEAEKERLG